MRLIKLIYLNVTFYLFFLTFSLAAVSTATTFIFFYALFMPHRRVMNRLRRAISWYGGVIIRVLPFPLVRIEYREYTQHDLGGPYLFVCNHRSASDPFLMAMLPGEFIQVANIWPFRIPVLGTVARIAGYLSVREIPFQELIVMTTKLLTEGVSLVAFPEGTRSRDNSVGQFHSAIFRVALGRRMPIVPLCITGTEIILPRGSALLHPGVVKMHRLQPLLWEEYGAFSPFRLKNYIRQIMMDEVASMESSG